MSFSVCLNFNGNCREAAYFYAKAFGQEQPKIMTYGEAPSNGEEIAEAEKNLVMYCALSVFGGNIMMMDCTSDFPLVSGNNISLMIELPDERAVKGVFDALKDGGIVMMDLQKTFWSDLFGTLTDKFGIVWQIGVGNDAWQM